MNALANGTQVKITGGEYKGKTGTIIAWERFAALNGWAYRVDFGVGSGIVRWEHIYAIR